jgi:hypothetical protein
MSIARAAQIASARGAHRQVGRHASGGAAGAIALTNLEASKVQRVRRPDVHGGDARGWWDVRFEAVHECCDVGGRAFCMNLDTVGAVSNPPGKAVSTGKTKDVRPESDSLHHAADADTSGGARLEGGIIRLGSRAQVICDL